MKPTTFYYCANMKRRSPLFNSEDYSIQIDNELNYTVPPYHEMMLLGYLMYPQIPQVGIQNCHKWLSVFYDKLEVYQRDIFISKFKEDHPIENYTQTVEAPTYATNGLFSFYHPQAHELITITAEQEAELTEIVKNKKWESRKPVRDWFTKYYSDRGMWSVDKVDKINQISIEFIACKGYGVSDGKELQNGIFGVLAGATFIVQALFYIGGTIAVLYVLFLTLKLILS